MNLETKFNVTSSIYVWLARATQIAGWATVLTAIFTLMLGAEVDLLVQLAAGTHVLMGASLIASSVAHKAYLEAYPEDAE